MIKELVKLANHLDNKGLRKEADYLDGIIRKAQIPSLPVPDPNKAMEIVELLLGLAAGMTADPPTVTPEQAAKQVCDKAKELGLNGQLVIAGLTLAKATGQLPPEVVDPVLALLNNVDWATCLPKTV